MIFPNTLFSMFAKILTRITKETYRPEIFQFKSINFLGNKNNKSSIENFFKRTSRLLAWK